MIDAVIGAVAVLIGRLLWKKLADKNPVVRVMVTVGGAIVVGGLAFWATHYHP